MSLIAIVLTLIVIWVLLWLEETYIPMDNFFKKAIRVVVIVATVVWLLQVFGVIGYLGNVRIK